MATEAAQTGTQLPKDATLTGIHVAASSSDDAVLPLRGSVIHYSRTRNRFKIVPEGKMPHEAVFLPLMKMNSVCEGGRAVDDTVRPCMLHFSVPGSHFSNELLLDGKLLALFSTLPFFKFTSHAVAVS
jgi:hypothetical protein